MEKIRMPVLLLNGVQPVATSLLNNGQCIRRAGECLSFHFHGDFSFL